MRPRERVNYECKLAGIRVDLGLGIDTILNSIADSHNPRHLLQLCDPLLLALSQIALVLLRLLNASGFFGSESGAS